VTDGIESALEQARAAAGDMDTLAPGPRGEAANRYLAAGLLDEFELHVVPVLLGDGERLFVQVGRSSSGRSARSRRPA
jgi:dihydrofolate reductase